MNFAELADPEFWRQLLSSDFNRGYAAAIGLVFALLLLLLALKIIFKLLKMKNHGIYITYDQNSIFPLKNNCLFLLVFFP